MGFGGMFKKLTVFAVMVTIMATSVAAQPKPGCQSHCGNIGIPYPFGTRKGCNIGSDFFINCNTSFNPPKAFLSDTEIEVLNISLDDGHLRVQYDKSIVCNNVSDVINGSCSGIGCCQTAIPRGLQAYFFDFSSSRNHSSVLTFNPCSYVFIVEDGAYTFSTSDLSNLDFNKREYPLILDWTIGNQTCEEAKMDPKNYACKQNSACIDPESGPGYLCKCNHGFQGNPYLSIGCQDINECETLKPRNESGTCHNTLGSYNCSCPEGFEGDGQKNGTGIGLSIGLLFLIFGVGWLYRILQKRKYIKIKQKLFERNGGLLFQKKTSSNEGRLDKAELFSSKELEIATDQYNENRILGCGGQDMVYKGMLSDGRIVAVKKSKTVNEGYLEQFINEIFILSQIDHRNIVKLLGCCLETEVPLLVYEFIPNGTLSHLIHDENEEYPRSWDIRLRIAAEVASAISYLHSSASIPIYHRDIKSSNILLDEKFRAKVSDFGTSRSISIDQTHLTTQVLGTFGYLDPEYFQSSQFTEKSDVYSFGVVIVELLTGKKAISTFGSQEKRGLVSYFMSSMEENHLLDIVDVEIGKDSQKDEVVAVSQLAKRCLNLDGRYRPTMKEVAMEIERLKTRQGDCIHTHQLKQAEVIARKSIESWDFTSFSTEHYPNCSITSTSESDVHPLML
ncbi:hypothetical protein GOBAR_AA31546 [Gossypium barbadense]|uniref:Protein kinase domain-containing protein n=1 Tax=Gossypium barbadense TaxID=3634 RepID=A0A2P5WDI8_GOSBA|nr:hypothetical protein GOBAR_AA31546 [Gossypium barbadense]